MSKTLLFESLNINSLYKIHPYIHYQTYRTCDYTIGGLFMWAEYFKYEYAIYEETLFIRMRGGIGTKTTAYSIPIGKLSINKSVEILKEQNDNHLILSAVPEDAIKKDDLGKFVNMSKLDEWSDYLYEAEILAMLTGRKYNKKRNHINSFKKNYPLYSYEGLDGANSDEVLLFFKKYHEKQKEKSPIHSNELKMTESILVNYDIFIAFFKGGILRVDGEIAAYTIGEIVNDTLYVHIEKANTHYSGAYEMINMLFANDIINAYPTVVYINREEDVGDAGLRKSKLSYNPIRLLNKYNIEIHG